MRKSYIFKNKHGKEVTFYEGQDVKITLPMEFLMCPEDMPKEIQAILEPIKIFDGKTGKITDFDVHDGSSEMAIIKLDKEFNNFTECLIPLEYVQPFDRYIMNAHIYFPNDPSVGMFPYSYDMTIYRFTEIDDSSEYREDIRAKIQELYKNMDDSSCFVSFDDEREW
jgi:hypothetical protein